MVSTGVFGLFGDHLAVVSAKPPGQRWLSSQYNYGGGTETRREDAMIEVSEEFYSSLHRQFKGDLLRPGASGYDDARLIWNGMFARTPGVIARCADSGDLQNAIRAAAEAGVLTAVRCGGH